MILLDTIVVFESMRAAPAPAGQRWLDAQDAASLATTTTITTITVAELGAGLALLSAGAKHLRARAASLLSQGSGDRISGYDLNAASACGSAVDAAPPHGPAAFRFRLVDRCHRAQPWHRGGNAQGGWLRGLRPAVDNPWLDAPQAPA